MKNVKRELGFWMLLALVMGNMIGSGIFLLPSALAGLGTISIGSWIVTGVGATFLALVFSRLSTQYPVTGGPYVYCHKGFGEFVGFQVAFTYWLYMVIGSAGISVALTGYLSQLLPALQTSQTLLLISSLCVLWFVIGINIFGVLFAGAFQLMMTILKILPLILITVVGLFSLNTTYLTEFNVSGLSDVSAISKGAMLTMWAFLGLESACVPADAVKNPLRTIPLATICGVLAASVIYIISTVSIMGNISIAELHASSAPFAVMGERLLGPWGGWFVTIGAMVACLGTLNGWIFLQSQLGIAAGKDKLFPTFFNKLSSKGTPILGLLFSGVLISILLIVSMDKSLVDQFTDIITMATLTAIIVYFLTAVSDLLLRAKLGHERSIGSFVKASLIAIVAFCYVFWSIVNVDMKAAYSVLLLLMISFPVYAFVVWQRKKNEFQESL